MARARNDRSTTTEAKVSSGRLMRLLKPLAWLGCMGAFVGASVVLVPWDRLRADGLSDLYPIGAVRVGGELRNVTEEELSRAISPYVSAGFFDVDVEAIRDVTQSIAWVSHASVRRVWPDSLQLGVIEHKAAARWAAGGLLNDRGVPFAPDASTYPDALPLLGGPIGTERNVLERYAELIRTLGPVLGHPMELVRSEQDIWRAHYPGSLALVFGEKQWGELSAFREVYAALLRPLAADIARIDLRYPNGFSVRWHDDDKPLLAVAGAVASSEATVSARRLQSPLQSYHAGVTR